MRPPGWILTVVFLSLAFSRQLQADSFEIVGSLLSSDKATAKIVTPGDSPILYFQSSAADILSLTPGGTKTRVPIYVSSLVDVSEDNSQILCLYAPSRYSPDNLPTATYLTSPMGGAWLKIPNPPEGAGRLIPGGFTPGGKSFGTVSQNTDFLWLRDQNGTFTTHTWTEAGSVKSIGAEGHVLVGNHTYWTTSQGAQPIPGGYSSDRVSATSANGRWLVSAERHPTQYWLNRLLRWSISETGQLGEPTIQLLPREMRANSFARVLDDGTVFLSTSTGSSTAFRSMDVHVWHANGALQRLADAIAPHESTRIPIDWTGMGKVFDVSADGRSIVCCREKPESMSINSVTEVWWLNLDTPLIAPEPTNEFWVRQTTEHTGYYNIHIANAGSVPLKITSAVLAGPDAALFKLASNAPTFPLELAAGAAVSLSVSIDYRLVHVDSHAELQMTTDSATTPTHTEQLIYHASQMPQITVSAPAPNSTLFWPSLLGIQVGIEREIPLQITVRNASNQPANNCRISFEAQEGLVVTPQELDLFDIAQNQSRTLHFSVKATRAGEFIPKAIMQPVSGFRVSHFGELKITAITAHQLRWVAEDQVTELDPETMTLDFGDIPVGGWGKENLHLKYTPNGDTMEISTFNSMATDAHAYLINGSPNSYTPMMESWTRIHSSTTAGVIKRQLTMSPKKTGPVETVVRFDSKEAGAPVHIRVRCNGIEQPAVFFDQPKSAIFLLGEKLSVKARAKGSFSVVDTLRGAQLQSSGPDEYSFTPNAGVNQLKINYTGGSMLSQEFTVGVLNGYGKEEERYFKIGDEQVLQGAPASNNLQQTWLKDGEELTGSQRILISKNILRLTKMVAEDAGEYTCRYTLSTPEGEITRNIAIANLIFTPQPPAPQVSPFSLRPAREGEFLQFYLTSADPTDRWTVKGLPPGLTFKDGMVRGFIRHNATGEEPKTYLVRVQASNRGLKGPEIQVPWLIEPFADSKLAGTYHGVIERGWHFPEGGTVKVTLSAHGSGSFSIKGARAKSANGKLLLAGGGPDITGIEYDPPLPVGMVEPPALPTFAGLGKARVNDTTPILSLSADGENILVGSVGTVQNLTGAPVIAFRQARPSTELLTKSNAPFSMHLKIPGKEWLWKPHAQSAPQAGRSDNALTFFDTKGRPHILGSKDYATDDHWVWDAEGLTWVSADATGIRPVSSPKLSVRPGQISWQAPQGGDFWTFTSLGALWKWPAEGSGWQIIQTDLPAESVGHSGELGVPHPDNRPRGRTKATTWITADGDLWMFGGVGLVDLWRYQPQTGLWTWMAGRVAKPNEEADWRSDGILEPGNGTGPGWVGNDGRLWLHQGLQDNDFLWTFSPVTATWSLEYQSTGTRVQPGLASFSKRQLDAPETGTSPGERTHRALTWTSEDGKLYLFGGATYSYSSYYFPYDADFYIWHYDPVTRQWVCDGLEADGYNMAGIGFNAAQKWHLPDGRLLLKNVARVAYLNGSDPHRDRLFEYGPNPLQNVAGFLSVKINTNGSVKWTGRLPDNEVVTGSGGLAKATGAVFAELGVPEGSWVSGFYSPLARNSRSSLGFLSFDEIQQTAAAMLDWYRPEATSVAEQRLLPEGFKTSVLLGEGWRHQPLTWKESLPTGPITLAPFLDLPTNQLSLSLDSRQRFTASFSTWQPNKMKVSFSPANGLLTLSGTIPDPSNPQVARPWNLQGLLIPHDQSAAGLFTLPTSLDATIIPIPIKQANQTQIHVGGFESAPE